MKNKFVYLVTILLFAFWQTNAQQTAKVTPSKIGYLEYLPQGYNSNTNKYPLVISLHGIKERGTTSTNIQTIKNDTWRVANVGLPKYIKYGTQYSFICVSPQLKNTYGNWPADYIIEVINHVKTYLRVDPNRIYITGLSLGGGGVWTAIAAYPKVFAGALPICPSKNALSSACKIAAEDVAVWDFHGDRDAVVHYSVSSKMINAINACNPKCNPLAKLTIFGGGSHIIWDKVYKDTNALNWMLSFRNGSVTEPSNNAPLANAGSDKTITLPTNHTVISGSGSDNDGSIRSYSWTQVSGPSTAVLTNKTTASLTAGSLVAGTYNFQLKVTDNDGAFDTDNVAVYVNASADKNAYPSVSAGGDKTITLPTNSVSLTGSASDSDGRIASYLWTKKSGGNASLSGTTSNTLRASNLVQGTYVFTLTVKDDKGAAKSDDVLVTVNGAASTTNKAPIANAGADRLIQLPTTSATVWGTATDPDGTISSWAWSKISGNSCSMSNTNSRNLGLSGLRSGTYIFRLTVKDNKGTSDTDDITLVVNAPPVVNAGSDRTVSLPISSLSLTASATDADGTIAEYTWSKYSGPILSMQNNRTRTVTLSNFYAGTYVIKLAVKDNKGSQTIDYVKIVVNGYASIETRKLTDGELASIHEQETIASR